MIFSEAVEVVKEDLESLGLTVMVDENHPAHIQKRSVMVCVRLSEELLEEMALDAIRTDFALLQAVKTGFFERKILIEMIFMQVASPIYRETLAARKRTIPTALLKMYIDHGILAEVEFLFSVNHIFKACEEALDCFSQVLGLESEDGAVRNIFEEE